MRAITESLNRLYHNGKITEEVLRARLEKCSINEEEFKFITGKDY